MILVDASGLVANYDRGDRYHDDVDRILARPEPRILSPFVLAEVDYLVTKLAGQAAELALLTDVARGAHDLASFGAVDIASARGIVAPCRCRAAGRPPLRHGGRASYDRCP